MSNEQYLSYITINVNNTIYEGPGWLNELGSWIT